MTINNDVIDLDEWLPLKRYAEIFSDIQRLRIGTANRIRAALSDASAAEELLKGLQRTEEDAAKATIDAYRAVVPVGIKEWQKKSIGVGEHMLARLLGTIGHPRIATPHHWEGGQGGTSADVSALPSGGAHAIRSFADPERPQGEQFLESDRTPAHGVTEPNATPAHAEAKPNPTTTNKGSKPKEPRQPVRQLVADPPYQRNIAKLWAYCGHGDPARRRTKGMTQEEALALGSPRAKMIVHLMAELCIRQRHGAYRKVYDEARAVYATRPNDEWSDLRRHNAALRKVGKEILRDLWVAAGDVDLPEEG